MRILTGRTQLFTDYKSPFVAQKGDKVFSTLDDICMVFNEVLQQHVANAGEIEYLLNYVKGRQDILYRTKEVRPDIDNKVVLNHASQITRNLVGYTFGKPIKYVPREAKYRKTIKMLNDYISNEDKFTSDQEIATYLSVCGVAYRGVFYNPYDIEGDNPFSLDIIDPRNCFVVYASNQSDMPVMGVTFYETNPTAIDMNQVIITVYTHDNVYVFRKEGVLGAIAPEECIEIKDNPVNRIPIVEYTNNCFRMGDWETSISLLDAINVVSSDSVNDLSQFVQSLLVAINAEFTGEMIDQLKASKMISIISSKELPADIKYIAQQADGDSVEALRNYLLDQLEIITGLPSRNTKSGGGADTGDAVYMRDGYENLEIVARVKESYFRKGERLTLGLIIRWLEILEDFRKIKVKDVDIKFTRNSTDNLLAKANAISILNGAQIITPTDTLALTGISTEPDELAERGREYWDEKNEEARQNMLKTSNQINPNAQNQENINKQNNKKMNNPNNNAKSDRS